METDDVASGEQFSAEVLGSMHLAIDQSADAWQ
ncbi:hypothetical protein BT93_E1838 [Corymbia citriodora subsp. variegata]|nr:hypothetical protein BT93_E1838 [Corymbia citriodora subsp. variegata]